MLSDQATDQTGYDIEYGDYQLDEDLPAPAPSSPIQVYTRDEVNSFAWLLLFPVLIIIAVLSFGAPCWYCRSYRFTRTPAKEERVGSYRSKRCVRGKELPQNYEAAWQRTIQEAQRQWRIYQILSIAILPALLKTFVASPTQKCFLAHIFANVALLGAMMQVIATIIYKEYIETFQQSAVAEEWLRHRIACGIPQNLYYFGYSCQRQQCGSGVTGALSFVLSTWAEGYPGAISGLCPSSYMNILPSVTGASALIALTDVMFMVLTLQSFALNDKS